MSFQNKVRARHYAMGKKGKSAGLKNLTRLHKGQPGHDIPRPKPPREGRSK